MAASQGSFDGSEASRLGRLFQGALKQLQPVLAPEDLARRQHEARRSEDAHSQRLLCVLLPQRVEFGVGSATGAQLRGIETGPLSG